MTSTLLSALVSPICAASSGACCDLGGLRLQGVASGERMAMSITAAHHITQCIITQPIASGILSYRPPRVFQNHKKTHARTRGIQLTCFTRTGVQIARAAAGPREQPHARTRSHQGSSAGKLSLSLSLSLARSLSLSLRRRQEGAVRYV